MNGQFHPAGLSSFDATLRWLVSRLTTTIDEEENYDEYFQDYYDGYSQDSAYDEKTSSSKPVEIFDSVPNGAIKSYPPFVTALPHWTGYNGRSNKTADTCYAFWVGASLNVHISTNLLGPSCPAHHPPISSNLTPHVPESIR